MVARIEHDGRIDHLVRQGLEELRRKLLDLTNRNPLLSFKFSDRSRRSIRIVDEVPDQLYERLVDEQTPTKLYFVGLPDPPDEATAGDTASSASDATGTAESNAESAEGLRPRTRRRRINIEEWARQCGVDPSFELPRQRSDRAAHQDNRIQTLYFEDDLEAKLRSIRELANLTQQEIGISTLYVAFGFLEWHEADNSDKTHFAPLLLLPVQIDRELKHHRYRYFVQSGEGADALINITLRERLKRNFDLVLPEFEDGDLPEDYMQRVERAIESQKRWRVLRQVVVSHFSFTRLAMYEDLASDRWPTAPLERHPLISALIVGADTAETGSIDADRIHPDSPEADRQVPVLITDADSSQFAAILDVMQGRSFALKGPPGTGKSQTITNLIAAALAQGKRVLFVAEKMAALDVVANRLKEAGLGDFLLELHSTKVQKKRVLESFEQRLRLPVLGDNAKLQETLDGLRTTRDALRRYVDVMNRPIGPTGYTLHEAYWEEQSARRGLAPAILRELDSIRDTGAADVARHQLDERRNLLDQIAVSWSKCAEIAGSIQAHPLNGFENPCPEGGDQGALLADCVRLREVAGDVRRIGEVWANTYGFPADERFPAYKSLATALMALPPSVPGVETKLLGMIKTPADVAALRRLERDLAALCQERKVLANFFSEPDRVIAQADSLIEQARQLQQHLAALSITDTCQLPRAEILDDLERSANVAKRTISSAEYFCHAAGISLPLGVLELRNLLKALALLRETPPTVLSARAAMLYEPHAEEQLAAFAREAAELRNDLSELGCKVDLNRIASAAELRHYSRTLIAANLFTRLFSADYRAAKRHYRQIAVKRKASRNEIAQVFSEAADVLARCDAFEANADLRVLAGASFKGLSTPFPTLQGVVDFAKRARALFSSLQPAEKPFLDTLLKGDAKLLVELTRGIGEADQREAERWCHAMARQEQTTAARLVELQLEQIASVRDCIRKLQYARPLRELSVTELLAALRKAKQIADLLRDLRPTRPFQYVCGNNVQPTDEIVQSLRTTLDYADQVLAQPLPGEIHAALLSTRWAEVLKSLGEFSAELQKSCACFEETLERISQRYGLDVTKWLRATAPEHTLREIEARMVAIEKLPDSAIAEWVTLCRLRARARSFGAATEILRLVEDEKLPAELASRAYCCVHFRSLIYHMQREIKDLPDWTGAQMSALRSRLAKLDKDHLQASRHWLRCALSQWEVPPGVGRGAARERTERALIEHEIGKQRRHLPLRELLRRAGDAARALKPCFMMSPASVAQFLPSEMGMFDLLIIDEASQMRLEEAIGSFARARQAVVVGDPMQLPPTSFFDAFQDDTEDDSDDDKVDVHVESVLDKALSCWRPRELNWHYRSRHHSLIAFSNREFYGDRLIVFPSPAESSGHLGVELLSVGDGVYRSHVNVREAEEVVKYVASAMRMYPDKSIGVVAVNQPQKDLLAERFDQLFADDSFLEEYRTRWAETLEPFMVKNLENVQGDERDIIVISTVYGPTAPGGPVMQRFGPINSKVGHRRLNVLFTRAKEKVVLVSSLKPENISVQSGSNPGVAALKAYLEYARSGRLERGVRTGRDYESPFEREVAEIILELGFEAEPQVGVAGYFLDLAVRHPERREHFVLGIECDGATYHSARSARDRDRLRQEVLEGLGWKLYRIWSTDWFANRSREIGKLEEQIRLAIGSY